MKCNAGHVFTWSSSPVIRNANRRAVFKCNLVFASSLLFSGNNYYKIQQFFKFMDVSCIAPSTYFTYQRLYLCPVISNFYNKKTVISILFLYLLITFIRSRLYKNLKERKLLSLVTDAVIRQESVQNFVHIH